VQGYTLNSKKGVFDTLQAEALEGLITDEVRDQLFAGGIELLETYQELKKQLVKWKNYLMNKHVWEPLE
jgi:hypothetical protein